MDIRKATLAGCRIPEVAHINLPRKRDILASEIDIGKLFLRKSREFGMNSRENLLDGSVALRSFTKHKFFSRLRLEL